jgi:N-acetylneuraminate lyase
MESIVKYFVTIIEHVDIPMILYNFPGNSGVNFDLDDPYVVSLLQDERVLGVKHTNRDLYEMERILRINPDLNMYNGYDEVYLNALPLGIKGAIGSTFNVTTSIFKKIGELYEEGKIVEALAYQKRANILMDAFIKVGLIPAIKFTLEFIGIPAGKPRLPFMELDIDSKTYLGEVLDKYLK